MTEVIMPKMGDAMEEGTLLEWLKGEGEKVKSVEIIGTIQTDKATLELEAPGTGVLSGILAQSGETIPVGKPIAAILKEGEALPEGWGGGTSAPSGNGSAKSEPAAKAETPAQQPEAEPAEQEPVAAKSEGRVKASPLAKKIAAEKGIDLAQVSGTGPGGRITEKDVRETKPKSPAQQQLVAAAEDAQVPLNRLRQITAERTLQSKQQAPHFYVTVEVDLERLSALRSMFEEDESGKASINDFVIRACALALREMPIVNSTYQGKNLLQFGAVNIGMAVALEDGLTVPVLHNADQLSLRQISTRSKELAKKAHDNKLHPDELSGSTFSISNMGMLNVDDFVAIINQPNAAILAVATARKRVVVNEEDELEVRLRMNITGSFDHRVVDGAVGARFMNLVKDYLESPTRLLS